MSYQKLKVVEALSFRERIEARIKATEKLKSRHLANIEAVLTRPESYNSEWYVKDRYYGANIVTTTGDIYYAKMAAGDSLISSPSVPDFVTDGRLTMRTSTPTITKSDTYSAISNNGGIGHHQGITTGYPTANDGDTDNTGRGTRVVTWTYNHGTTVANANSIDGGGIHGGGNSPSTGTALLTHFNFSAPFDKSSTDTLKVMVNHLFDGQ